MERVSVGGLLQRRGRWVTSRSKTSPTAASFDSKKKGALKVGLEVENGLSWYVSG